MADINQDSIVDISDYHLLVTNFLQSPIKNARADINSDGIVDISDYHVLVSNFLLSATGCTTSTGSGPTVQNMAVLVPPSSKYAKTEWVFDLNKTYPNPYYFYDATDTASANLPNMTWFGTDGVSVDMQLTSPTGKRVVVPAFWMEDYTRVRSNGIEYLGKKDNGRWHVRFTPEESGTYTYLINAVDKTGTTSTSPQTFVVSTNAVSNGFVRQSTKDPRFLAYQDGTPFIPIGSGQEWWADGQLKSYSYEDEFNTFGQNKINMLRIWDQSDFALGVEGAQPVWVKESTAYGVAIGTQIGPNNQNVHAGLRSANPSVGNGWYQRLAITEPTKSHKLTAWVKTDAVSGGNVQVLVTKGTSFTASQNTIVGQLTPVTGTTGWTQYSATFVPNSQVVSLFLLRTAGSGQAYIDDIAFGPSDSSGNIAYNIVSDPDMERHFAKGAANNDPDSNHALPRPIGNFFNPWASYEMDKIIEAAQANNVKIQDCSCSGAWFTWPQDSGYNFNQKWVMKSWQRNFRYRVARWGYSPSILAWELWNEMGHVNPSGTPDTWNFLLAYGAYQKATDPYGHLRTNSQNSQAYSPAMWSSSSMDLANYHDYMDFRNDLYANISPDEVLFINNFAWCLRDITRANSSPYCQRVGLGDGSTWTGPAKPWIWGEIGVLNPGEMQGGEAGKRLLHNIVWAGLFSPVGTTPLDWHQSVEDNLSRTEKYASRKAAATFFSTVDYDGGLFTYLNSPTDTPPTYTGETIGTTNAKVRISAMKRADKKAAYLWIQNRDYIWSKASTTPTPVSSTITISNMLNSNYTVSIWNTSTGVVMSSLQVTPSNGTVTFPITNLSTDIAIKVETL